MKILHSNIKGEGMPLLILHGFLGMSDNWKTLGNLFSEKGFQVHLIDQRNHGRSFHTDAFSPELMAEDLLHYIDHHQLKNVQLTGHSMGGKTAMFFAAAYPQFVSKLLIADIGPKYYPQHHQDILRGLQAMDFSQIGSRNEADTFLATYIPEMATRQFLLKNLYRTPEKKLAFRFHLESLIKNVDAIGKALPPSLNYTGKTLFLKGERSAYITEDDNAYIKIQFPNAVIDEIRNAGHWLHADQPEAFFSRALSFLQS